jgi:hypothetical protein
MAHNFHVPENHQALEEILTAKANKFRYKAVFSPSIFALFSLIDRVAVFFVVQFLVSFVIAWYTSGG